ncbi:hypothetical protein VIGAN_05090500 [Vigna angularis var. angularis]|uniref:Mitochondrial pyruvate carrier n=1 Tax=Vigna angularis var. angularis TaxID=157739 RepID=A0A0S3S3U8_PHAAN|nr:hypothetical protein VIGAN_05090500 [Vigna angularis var. angularis]
MAAAKLQALWNHPAGPKTIHFWAPTFKWGISIANIADFSKPPEKLSYPQQIGKHVHKQLHLLHSPLTLTVPLLLTHTHTHTLALPRAFVFGLYLILMYTRKCACLGSSKGADNTLYSSC